MINENKLNFLWHAQLFHCLAQPFLIHIQRKIFSDHFNNTGHKSSQIVDWIIQFLGPNWVLGKTQDYGFLR